MAKSDTTLENILLVVGVSALVVVGGAVIIAAVGYSVITAITKYLSRKVTESDNMGICNYFKRGKR